MTTTYNDERTRSMAIKMAQHFDEFESDYRGGDWCSIVAETDDYVIIADHKGYEFDEWEQQFGDDFSQTMHDLARSVTDRSWGSDYPLVFDKLESEKHED